MKYEIIAFDKISSEVLLIDFTVKGGKNSGENQPYIYTNWNYSITRCILL